MVTIKDVAQRAGVSTAVVSAVLGGRSRTVRMSEATRQRVEQAIAETGYRANHAAQSLSRSRTGVIAAVVPRIANPVFEQVISGLQAEAEENGEVLLLADALWVEAGTHLMARMAGSGMVDGFLVRSTTWGSERVEEFTKRGLPFVILQTPGPDHPISVWADDRAGIALAARHLIALGHRDIMLVGGHGGRAQGLVDELERAGLPHGEAIAALGYDLDRTAATVRSVMSGDSPPTALVIDNIISAPGALAALQDLGIRVPEDLSIIVFHDLPIADHLRPAPTTVRMPMELVGRHAYRTLQRMISGEDVSSEVVDSPAPVLVDRGSTGPPPRR